MWSRHKAGFATHILEKPGEQIAVSPSSLRIIDVTPQADPDPMPDANRSIIEGSRMQKSGIIQIE
jgi:hypothetical protein